jgi:hypothetical protein
VEAEKSIKNVVENRKIILIGGYPKGYSEPFHIKTKSGKILRKITDDLKIHPVFFDLWNSQKEEESRILKTPTKNRLTEFVNNECTLIALGRYIEKAVADNGYECIYLPHPASRDKKYIDILKNGLTKIIKNSHYEIQ